MEKSLEEIYAEIDTLKQQAEALRAEKVAQAKVDVRKLINLFGLSASDCGFSGGKSGASFKTKSPVAVKYRHPDNDKLTWTGRGKTPGWLLQVETEGRSRTEFLV